MIEKPVRISKAVGVKRKVIRRRTKGSRIGTSAQPLPNLLPAATAGEKGKQQAKKNITVISSSDEMPNLPAQPSVSSTRQCLVSQLHDALLSAPPYERSHRARSTKPLIPTNRPDPRADEWQPTTPPYPDSK